MVTAGEDCLPRFPWRFFWRKTLNQALEEMKVANMWKIETARRTRQPLLSRTPSAGLLAAGRPFGCLKTNSRQGMGAPM
jgi:hypothetical protein